MEVIKPEYDEKAEAWRMEKTDEPSIDIEIPRVTYHPRGGVHSTGATTASVTP